MTATRPVDPPTAYQTWARRVDAATPRGRDRTVDALRAVAIVGVVLGHWLVTAVVGDPYHPGSLHGASPLTHHPALTPATWFLQTLGPFFAAAGYAAARSSRRPNPTGNPTGNPAGRSAGGTTAEMAGAWAGSAADGSAGRDTGPGRPGWAWAMAWLGRRLGRVARPVVVLAVVWVPATLLLGVVGAPAGTRRLVWSLVSHPLWFLLVYLVLTVLAPVLRAAFARFGLWCLGPPVVVVALSDLARSPGTHVLQGLTNLPGLTGPHGLAGVPGVATALGLLAVPVGWAGPYLLGMAVAGGRVPRRAGVALVAGGVVGGAVLVAGLGYPASAVGVPGDGWSNLDPPSLFALALAAAQLGVFVLVRPWAARVLRRPGWWAPVAGLNRVAMTVYCWHQTALLLVTFAGLAGGQPPGLLDAPGDGWAWHRLAWLPVFAGTLAVLVVLFRRFEAATLRESATVPGSS